MNGRVIPSFHLLEGAGRAVASPETAMAALRGAIARTGCGGEIEGRRPLVRGAAGGRR